MAIYNCNNGGFALSNFRRTGLVFPISSQSCDCVFAAAQFQVQLNEDDENIDIPIQTGIPYNTEIYNSGEFTLDTSNGEITIAEPGVYKIDYQMNIYLLSGSGQSPNSIINLSIKINDIIHSTSTVVWVDRTNTATSIVEITEPSSILTIINNNETLGIRLTGAQEVSTNITIVRLR